MTIHLTTITSNVVVAVSDRLILTQVEYKPLQADKYKHLVLSTDDALVVVSFAGFAGILSGSQLKATTVDSITSVLSRLQCRI